MPAAASLPSPEPSAAPTRLHERRLVAYYRSAGWPCLDGIEIDLLNAGLIERVPCGGGLETIRVTAAGIAVLGRCRQRNRGAYELHERLVAAVAQRLAESGRLAFRGLALRGRTSGGWRLCRPDVYSLRQTSVAAYACPVIHEVKVRRADLLADLANPMKRAAYQALSSEFYYVVPAGLARLEEIPPDCGVLVARDDGLAPGRASARRQVEPSIGEWMAIARRAAEPADPLGPQDGLR